MKRPSFDKQLFAAIVRRRLLISLPLVVAGSLVFTALTQTSQSITTVKQPKATVLQTTSNNTPPNDDSKAKNHDNDGQIVATNALADSTAANTPTTDDLAPTEPSPPVTTPAPTTQTNPCTSCSTTTACTDSCPTQPPTPTCGGCNISPSPRFVRACPLYMCTAL